MYFIRFVYYHIFFIIVLGLRLQIVQTASIHFTPITKTEKQKTASCMQLLLLLLEVYTSFYQFGNKFCINTRPQIAINKCTTAQHSPPLQYNIHHVAYNTDMRFYCHILLQTRLDNSNLSQNIQTMFNNFIVCPQLPTL